jgi:hypothetical protein
MDALQIQKESLFSLQLKDLGWILKKSDFIK